MKKFFDRLAFIIVGSVAAGMLTVIVMGIIQEPISLLIVSGISIVAWAIHRVTEKYLRSE